MSDPHVYSTRGCLALAREVTPDMVSAGRADTVGDFLVTIAGETYVFEPRLFTELFQVAPSLDFFAPKAPQPDRSKRTCAACGEPFDWDPASGGRPWKRCPSCRAQFVPRLRRRIGERRYMVSRRPPSVPDRPPEDMPAPEEWTWLIARAVTGGLSNPSKMPGFGYSTPAKRCQTGSKLKTVAGSTCSGCYALQGWYPMSFVQNTLEYRFSMLRHPLWVDAMAWQISQPRVSKSGVFRWHDSGDLQGTWHLERIAEVARRTPGVRHWLPTREYGMVVEYLQDGGGIPDNLCIRISGHMIDGPPPVGFGLPVSTVCSGARQPMPSTVPPPTKR